MSRVVSQILLFEVRLLTSRLVAYFASRPPTRDQDLDGAPTVEVVSVSGVEGKVIVTGAPVGPRPFGQVPEVSKGRLGSG